MSNNQVKIKAYGDDRHRVLQVLNEVRDLYAPDVTQSDIKPSAQGGWHGFLTIYKEEAGRR